MLTRVILAAALGLTAAMAYADPPDAVDDTANFSGNARLELHRTDTVFESAETNRLRQSVHLSDGGAIFAWDHGFDEDYGTPPAEFSIYAQRYDAAGNQSGGAVDLLSGFNMENVDDWAVIPAGGGFALILREQNGGTTHTIRYYDAAGTLTDGPHTLDMDNVNLYEPRQEIAILPNGSIVYPRDDSGGTGDSAGVFFMLMDADGDRIANETRANQTTVQFEQRLGQVVAFTDNRFGFLISDDSPADTGFQRIIAQIFNSDGTVAGAEVLVGENNTPGGRREDNLDARLLPDGSVLMMAYGGEDDDVYGVIPDDEPGHMQDEHLYTQRLSNQFAALAGPAAFTGIRYLPASSAEGTPSSTYTMGERSWRMRTDGTSLFRWERVNDASDPVTSGVILDRDGRPITGLFEIDNDWDRYPMAFVGGNFLVWTRVSDGSGGIDIQVEVHDIVGPNHGFIDVLANDSDPDTDPFAITQIAGNAALDAGDSVTLSDGATVINAGDRLFYSGGVTVAASAQTGAPIAQDLPSIAFAVDANTSRNNAHEPRVLALADGSFLVAWAAENPHGGACRTDYLSCDWDILGQRFYANGDPLGDEVVLLEDIPLPQWDYALLTTGNLAIIFNLTDLDFPTQRRTEYAVVDLAGNEISAPAPITEIRDHGQQRASIAAGPLGGFMIAWLEHDAANTGLGDIAVRRYNNSGTPLGADFIVNAHTDGFQNDPAIALTSTGGFVVAWHNITAGPGAPVGPRFRVFDATDTPLTGEVVFDTDTDSIDIDVSPNDVILLASLFTDGDRRIRVETRNLAGGLLTQSDSPVGEFGSNGPRAAFYEGDNWTVVWGDGESILAASNGFDELETLQTEPADTNVYRPHIASAGDGNGAIAWTEEFRYLDPSDDLVREYNVQATFTTNGSESGGSGVSQFTYTIADAEGSDTATVTVNSTGGPAFAPPIADDDALAVNADDAAADVTATLLGNDDDPNNPDLSQTSITSLFTGNTAGLATLNAGAVTYDPNGAFDALDQGDVGADQFSYILTGPGNLSDIGLVSITVNGVNDAPVAGDVGVTLGEKSPETGIRNNILAQASDVDEDDAGQLQVTAVDTTGTMGSVTLLPTGAISYDPNGAFNGLDDGESDTDTFTVTVSDPLGASDTATVTITINGASHTLAGSTSGLGTGNIASSPAGLDCGNGGTDCAAELDTEAAISMTATAAAGSLFDGWETGPCAGTATNPCGFAMSGDIAADARFELETPPAGRIVAATLPGARSGYVGGPDVTAFLSVVSRATTPAQDCTISAEGAAPFDFTYRSVDGANNAIGDPDPRFDLAPGGTASFVLAMTPTAATSGAGYTFQPIIACDNATLDPIEGINSILLSFGNAPVPDVLSIGITPSADGVIRITNVPGAGFMSVSAINIGAGDGLSGPNAVTVTAAVDTGSATLPLEVSVCETNAQGVCLAPRDDSVRSVIDDDASFFAVFARDTGGPGVSFDPANARVFLRFTDDNGVIRSVASAAVTSPGAADQPPAIMAGRWSVLVRTEDGIWPSLRRGHLIVLENGTAILDDGLAPRRVALQGDGISQDGYAAFRIGDLAGQARPDGALRLGNSAASTPGALWGVRDQRGDVSADLTLFPGRYGGITVAENGAIFGEIGGCTISAPAPSVYGAIHASTAGLSGCGDAGRYTIIFDAPANDAASPALIIAGDTTGWRVTR